MRSKNTQSAKKIVCAIELLFRFDYFKCRINE
jgi:hypothetical protein